MGTLTYGMKAARVLRFLLGLRHEAAAEALQAYGFTERELEEGLRLLRDAVRPRLAAPAKAAGGPTLLDRLDAWERLWHTVADAVLSHGAPEVHEAVFRNLGPARGADLLVAVSTLAERLEALRAAPLGSPEGEAWALLVTHGMTAEVLAEADGLVSEAARVRRDAGRRRRAERPLAVEAVEAMWAWYLKWSRIARVVVTDGRALQAMGFKRRRVAGAAGPPQVDDPAGEAAAANDDHPVAAPPQGVDGVGPEASEASEAA